MRSKSMSQVPGAQGFGGADDGTSEYDFMLTPEGCIDRLSHLIKLLALHHERLTALQQTTMS